jgi:Domain of unknown function (DUF4148)
MKSCVRAAIAVALLGATTVAFGQQAERAPVSRAQVRAELAELRCAGYDPNDWLNYPENIQAAEQLARKAASEGVPLQCQR